MHNCSRPSLTRLWAARQRQRKAHQERACTLLINGFDSCTVAQRGS